MKPRKEKLPGPKYNLFRNTGWMIGLAWNTYQSVLALAAASALLGVAAGLIGLYITPVILAAIQSGISPKELIGLIGLFTGGLAAVYALTHYVNTNTLFGRIAVRLKIVALIQQKVMTTSYANTDNQDFYKKHGKAQTATDGNLDPAEAVWTTLTDLLKNIIGFVIYLFVLAALDIRIVLLVAGTAAVSFLIGNRLNGWGYRHRDEEAGYSRRMGYLAGKSRDHTLAKDIRLFGMGTWLQDMYDSTFRLYRSFVARGEKVYIWADITDVILTFARNGIAYMVLIGLVLDQGLTAADFLLYFTAVGGFSSWISGILSGFSTLYKQSLDLSAIREFLDYPEPFLLEDGLSLEPDADQAYAIELKDVSFRYPGADKDALEQINLFIKPGEKLAVVGLNGAGKTTMVKLLCGFLDPTRGEVLLNGQNIKQYNRRDVYRHFSAVFQDFSVLTSTLLHNIAQTVSDADPDRAWACAEKAGIAGKIKSLPNGMDTSVGREVYEDGTELSGGETQRLMLARALYKDAPVIVLDEPTAALDPVAESDIYHKYHELTAGRTSVYISHRLASTRFCDRIILLDGSRIAEEGTHDELVAAERKYAELYEIQARYYREAELQHD